MSKTRLVLITGAVAGGAALMAGIAGGAFAFGQGPMGPGGAATGAPAMMMRHFGRNHHMGGHRRRGMLRHADANGDGVITREEATARRMQRFNRFDLDKDGSVTEQEAIEALVRRFRGRVQRRIRSFDANGDGRVTREEFNAPVLERFSWRDSNGDGKLTRDEMPGMTGGWRGPGRGSHGGPGGFGPGRPQMQGPRPGMMGPGTGMRRPGPGWYPGQGAAPRQ